MKSEQITIMATTDGATASGTLVLKADLLYGSPTAIRIPKGLALKIWSKRITGADVVLKTQFCRDITADSPTWTDFSVETFDQSVEGAAGVEKRRPLIFRSLTGKEAVRFSYAQSVAAVSNLEANVEFCEIQ